MHDEGQRQGKYVPTHLLSLAELISNPPERVKTKNGKERLCKCCGAPLSSYNRKPLCSLCRVRSDPGREILENIMEL